MKISRFCFRLAAVSALLAGLIASATASTSNGGKKIEFTTKSKEAKDYVAQFVNQVETFQTSPQTIELAKKIVAADPDFAFGYYVLATASPSPAEAKPHIDKAMELGKKASDGERRYMEAVMLVRTQKTEEGIAIFNELAKQFPDERMVQMMLGQAYTNTGKFKEARAAFERAIQLDGSTPRVYTFLGNIALLEGNYSKARELFKTSWGKRASETAPFGAGYGLAYSYIYEGDMKSALKALQAYEAEYTRTGQPQQFPAVFIWNSIARLQLENGNPEEAIKAYEKGYATVSGSNLDEIQKKTWLGRLHHGRGRALAKMGKSDEAWKEADLIKKMIEENGKAGEAFWPSYHYLAGYLKLEAGDYQKAVEHLKQTDLTDPFHKLLLARAYEKVGDQANAQKLYQEIADFKIINLERALSYAEAKKRLKS